MEGYRGYLHTENSHVLNKDGIGTNFIQLTYHGLSFVQLAIVEYRVHRNVDLYGKLMCILTQLPDIINAVTHRCSGTKTGSTDVYSISTMVYGSHAALQILGR